MEMETENDGSDDGGSDDLSYDETRCGVMRDDERRLSEPGELS